MKRYRAEIYNSDWTVADMKLVMSKDVLQDYIVQGNSTIVVPLNTFVSRGNYVILREHGSPEPIYCGLVTNYTSDKDKTTITMQSFMSLLNIKIYMDLDQLETMDIESWLESYINEYFAGEDAYMNIKGLSIIKNQATTYDTDKAAITENTNNIYSLLDVVVSMFNVYGIVLDFDISAQDQTFIITMRHIDQDSVLTIKTNVSDVIDFNINLSNQSGKFNKIVYLNNDYYNPKDETVDVSGLTQRITFYWHPEGFEGYVSTDAESVREVPVRMTTKTAKSTEEKKDKDGNITTEGKTFEKAAEEDAYKTMYRDRYSDQIEITTKADSMVVMIGHIGQLYRILNDGVIYNSILTAKELIGENTVKLTFGVARLRMSQQIKILRREIANYEQN